MTRKFVVATAGIVAMVFVLAVSTRPALAQDTQQSQQPAPPPGQQPCPAPNYTPAEYNSYAATKGITSPEEHLRALDDFTARFPSSQLLPYAYKDYLDVYKQMKNYAKVIEYADKILALSDCQQVQPRLSTVYARCSVFDAAFNPKADDAKDQLTKTRDICTQGLKFLDALKKPDNLTDDQFATQKKLAAAMFYGTIGFASHQLKDYSAAADAYKAVLANSDNKNAVAYYRLGVAQLQENPAQSLDGFWALARAIALNVPGQAEVRNYLRGRISNYQQPACDSQTDAEMNEMIQLAAASPERPAGYTLPAAADLDKVRQGSTLFTLIADLQAGGDRANLAWLALCSAQFPEVVGKIIDVTPSEDSLDFKVFTASTNEEMDKATAANMDVVVSGQPEAARLKKDDGIKFSGTLASYDPQPFMLHWTNCKVDPSIIPEEKKAHPAHRVPRHKPAE